VETNNCAQGMCAEQLVGFSVSTDADRQALHDLERDLSRHHPLVLIGDRENPRWYRIQAIISLHKTEPQLSLVNISQPTDRAIIMKSITRLTGSSSLPQLFCRGRLLGGYDIVEEFVQDRTLVGFSRVTGYSLNPPIRIYLGTSWEDGV
jgi:glutaredoxin-related protein